MKGWKPKIALVAVSTVAALVAAEIAIRVAAPRVTHRVVCRHDPYLGWALIPNSRAVFRSPEWRVESQINEYGVRGEPIPYSRNTSRTALTRHVWLGDSFLEANHVALADRVSEQFAEMAWADVINGGVSGWSTDQQWLWYARQGHKWSPDCVVLWWYDNDAVGCASSSGHVGNKPRYEHDGSAWRLTNWPVPRPRVPWHVRLRSSSRLYMIARYALWRRPKAPPGYQYWRWPATDQMRRGMAAAEHSLSLLAERCRRDGTRLIIVWIPPRWTVYPDEWSAAMHRYDLDESTCDLMTYRCWLRAWCERHDVEFVDLLPQFRALADHQRLYWHRDSHWTPAGHRLAAQVLKEYLDDADATKQ